MMIREEKPNTRTKVKCTRCHKQYPFSAESIVEESIPHPYNTVTEGFLVCPYCGVRTHTYYMPDYLRFELDRLKQAKVSWENEKTVAAYDRYNTFHKAYQKNFDTAQKKYKELLGVKESSGIATD